MIVCAGPPELFPTDARAGCYPAHADHDHRNHLDPEIGARQWLPQIIDTDLEKAFYEARRAFHDARDDKRSRKD